MERRKIVRRIITICLFAALVAVIILSQNHDFSNPHSGIPRETWISGAQGHGFVVNNNQDPANRCYPCHEKKGLGGEDYCQSCHEQSEVEVNLP